MVPFVLLGFSKCFGIALNTTRRFILIAPSAVNVSIKENTSLLSTVNDNVHELVEFMVAEGKKDAAARGSKEAAARGSFFHDSFFVSFFSIVALLSRL